MLRNDGVYKIYRIQHQQRSNNEWVYSIYGSPDTNSKTTPCRDTFTASGLCWQKTGIHGVYDIRNARTGLKNARKNIFKDIKNGTQKTKLKLRLVCVELKQETIPVK